MFEKWFGTFERDITELANRELKKELATPIQVDEESKIFALPKYRIKLETKTNS